MRQIIFLIACCAALFAFYVGASAAKLTEQQVKDTCEKSFNQPATAQGPSRRSARSQ